MMLSSLIGGTIDKVIDSANSLIDNAFTSDDERNKAKIELMSIRQNAHIQAIKLSNDYEADITKRWESDNGHIVTRLVRPLVVVFLYVLFGAIVLTDGNIGGFTINAAYVPVLQTLLVTVTVAYFGSRGLEKVTKMKKGL